MLLGLLNLIHLSILFSECTYLSTIFRLFAVSASHCRTLTAPGTKLPASAVPTELPDGWRRTISTRMWPPASTRPAPQVTAKFCHADWPKKTRLTLFCSRTGKINSKDANAGEQKGFRNDMDLLDSRRQSKDQEIIDNIDKNFEGDLPKRFSCTFFIIFTLHSFALCYARTCLSLRPPPLQPSTFACSLCCLPCKSHFHFVGIP